MERLCASLDLRRGASGRIAVDLGRRVVDICAVAVIVLMLAIAVQVAGNLFDVNPLLRFGRDLPLLGQALTLNGLLDLQWHLMALVALIPAGIVWLRDRHVRVDFLYDRHGPRGRAATDLMGNLLFALPFLAMAIPAAWRFAHRAWRVDEGGANGGLEDLWLIKMALPLGLALLAAAVAWESLRLLRSLAR
ncbi:TRAP transporter small permease subunit [Rhodobacteraceae bacterium CCMM004]|nr:TRAP transporter small permease subunit [Rhodobacteraceae bacterium CCMM004]